MLHVLDELRSQRVRIEQVVSELIDVFGARMVAVIGGATSTRSVRAWRDAEYKPKSEDALRFALRIVDILAQREQKDVIRAWFGGTNDMLNDDNPALLIARNDASQYRDIVNAARAFISM